MVIAVIGENCAGKSTLAGKIQAATGGEIITGKDYLRMARSEAEARRLFQDKLKAALAGDNIIYVISEMDHLALVPDGTVRVLVRADLDTIKARFRERMRGNLPEPVSRMLGKKHGLFDGIAYDFAYDGASGDHAALCEALKKLK